MPLPLRASPWPALASDTTLPVSHISAGKAAEQPAPPAVPVGDAPSVTHGWGGWPTEDGTLATAIGTVALDTAIGDIQPPAATGSTVSCAGQTTDADDLSKGFKGGGYLVERGGPMKLPSRETPPACELRADWPTWTAGSGLLVVWFRKVLVGRSAARRSGKADHDRNELVAAP
jgi:hypothetical protein